MKQENDFLYHGSVIDIKDEFLDPKKGCLYWNDLLCKSEYRVYLTNQIFTAIGHVTMRYSSEHPLYVGTRGNYFIFDSVNAKPFGYIYKTEKPIDFELLNKEYDFGVSYQKVKIIEKYDITPEFLAKNWHDHSKIRIMKNKKRFFRMSKEKLAKKLSAACKDILFDDTENNPKFQKLLNKYTYTIDI